LEFIEQNEIDNIRNRQKKEWKKNRNNIAAGDNTQTPETPGRRFKHLKFGFSI